MKGCSILFVILLLGLATQGHASPEDENATDKKEVKIEKSDSNDADSPDETMKTSNNFGLGYYPVVYNGIYAIPRPELFNYGLGYAAYGGYDTQWSRYSRYQNYRSYDRYYQGPVYTYWG